MRSRHLISSMGGFPAGQGVQRIAGLETVVESENNDVSPKDPVVPNLRYVEEGHCYVGARGVQSYRTRGLVRWDP